MSVIGLIMNLLLAGLLVAALSMGVRLNKRLKALRDAHDGFARAVAELDDAAARAEQGLADLRAASDEALDVLSDRITTGRNLANRLERLVEQAPDLAARPSAQPARTAHDSLRESLIEPGEERLSERRLGALLAAAREARPPRRDSVGSLRDDRAPGRAPPAQRPRFTIDDDIFDDEPLLLDRAPRPARGAAR